MYSKQGSVAARLRRVRDRVSQSATQDASMHDEETFLPSPSDEERLWRVKAVAEARPDALARLLTLLQTQEIVPLRLVARRAPIRGRMKMVLEIAIEFDAPDLAPGALGHFVAILAELPTVLTVVVPDPVGAGPV